jgi:hypothetical protein
MSGAILPHPQYAFMAWCSVKAQGQLHPKLSMYTKGGRALLTTVMNLQLKHRDFNFLPYVKVSDHLEDPVA